MYPLTQLVFDKLQHDPHVDLQPNGPGVWKGNSPFRPEADSHNMKVEILNGRLVWTDHKLEETDPNYGGGEVALAKHYGIPLKADDAGEFETTKRAYRDLKEYAEAHGVAEEVFLRAGWRNVDEFEILKKEKTTGELVPVTIRRPALMIPTHRGKSRRYRCIDGNPKQARFMQDSNYQNTWYGLDGAINMAVSQGQPLVYVNGNPTVVIAQYYGIPAFTQAAGGEHAIPLDLLQELQSAWSGDIMIALDTDKHGRQSAQKIAAQLQHNRHCIIDLDPGLTPASGGMDLGDFLKLHNTDPDNEPNRPVERFWALKQEWKRVGQAEIVQFGLSELAQVVRDAEKTLRKNREMAEDQDTERVIARADAVLSRIKAKRLAPKIVKMADAVDETLETLEKMYASGETITGIRTRLDWVDTITGGTQPGVSIVMGATGMGKSTFLCTVAANMMADGRKLLIIPTELNKHEYMCKIASVYTGIPTKKLINNTFNRAELDSVREALSKIRESGVILDMVSPSPEDLKAVAHEYVPDGIDCMFVDSISHMAPVVDVEYTGRIYDALMEIARTYKLPIWASIQADSKLIEKRPVGQKLPRLSDAHGAQRASQDARAFFAIYRHDYYVKDESLGELADEKNFPRGTVRLINLKSRFDDSRGTYATFGFPNGTCFTNRPKPGDDIPF